MSWPDLNPDFTEENFRRVVDTLNTILRNITFEDHFGAQIVEDIQILANTEIRIAHALKEVPKYKIILRKSNDNAIICDGSEPWTENFITLANQGPNLATVTIAIFRR